MAARHEEGCYENNLHIFSCLQRTVERWRRGGGVKGHRILGDTVESWRQKPAISLTKSWGGYRSKTQYREGSGGSEGDNALARFVDILHPISFLNCFFRIL